jgi:hypothetical protein
VQELTDRLTSFYIDSVAIIAGIDQTGAHLYRIENPGVKHCYDTPFFVAAGVGEALATTQFMVEKFDKTWDAASALWLTFTAKARAELAGGVGTQTDVVAVTRFPPYTLALSDQERKLFYRIFERQRRREGTAFRDSAKEIAKRIFPAAPPEVAGATGGQTSTEERTPSPKAETNGKGENSLG